MVIHGLEEFDVRQTYRSWVTDALYICIYIFIFRELFVTLIM